MTVATGTRFVHPDVISTHFHLLSGDVVGDFGAGTGYFLRALSKAVGEEGKVYAFEIQKNLVDTLRINVKEWHLSNVEPMWCDLQASGGTKLADGVLDVGIMINTLFQAEDKQTALREAARTIRKGGKFFIVDWTESFAGLGPHPDHVVDAEAARTVAEPAGFTFEREIPAGEHHYGLAFRRA